MTQYFETDVAIVGAGPVGLFAVFELGMLKLSSILIDSLAEVGGQCAALYPEKPIFDIPAHPEIEGGALIHRLEAQAAPFTPLYLLDDEFAAEIANRTMHGVIHLGWVPDGRGGHVGQMAVLVKPNGMLGKAYMAAIRPFRHRVVYPPMLHAIERRWRAR